MLVIATNCEYKDRLKWRKCKVRKLRVFFFKIIKNTKGSVLKKKNQELFL